MRAASAEELLNVDQSGTMGYISVFAYVEGVILPSSVEKCPFEKRNMTLPGVPVVGLMTVLRVSRCTWDVSWGRKHKVASSVGFVRMEVTLD